MALKAAIRTGGDFLDLKQLVKDSGGPTLVVFRIRELRDPEPSQGFDGYTLPVIADAFIVDGPRAGEVHSEERFIGAITAVLRGVRNPNKQKGERPQPPVNEVGDEIVARVKLVNEGRSNEAAVGDEPSAVEMAAVEKAYEAAGGEALWEQGAEPEPVGAAAGGARKRPWD